MQRVSAMSHITEQPQGLFEASDNETDRFRFKAFWRFWDSSVTKVICFRGVQQLFVNHSFLMVIILRIFFLLPSMTTSEPIGSRLNTWKGQQNQLLWLEHSYGSIKMHFLRKIYGCNIAHTCRTWGIPSKEMLVKAEFLIYCRLSSVVISISPRTVLMQYWSFASGFSGILTTVPEALTSQPSNEFLYAMVPKYIIHNFLMSAKG